MKIKQIFNDDGKEVQLAFRCPGCKRDHHFDRSWKFDDNFEKPTVSPSILGKGKGRYETLTDGSWGEWIKEPWRCHSFIKNGMIQFLGDCTHKMVGMTVELPEIG